MAASYRWLLLALAACREPAPSDTDSGSAPTDVDPGWCGADDLAWAPAAVEVDGLPAVPVDVQTLDAVVALDTDAQSAQALATVVFRVGPDGGMPFLDLRQTPASLELDGDSVDVGSFASHAFSDQANAELRILEVELAPCTEHTLTVAYPLAAPAAPAAKAIAWGPPPGEVRWDFWFTDLYAGRYLEDWFPANLLFDRFSFVLDLSVASPVGHTLLTNAEVASGGANVWTLTFPATATAFSPLVVVRPSLDLVRSSATETFSNDQAVTIDVYRLATVPDTDPTLLDRAVAAVAANIDGTGDYPHGDRLLVYVWDDPVRSMEYDGAVTTMQWALEHEIFHSWWGRGIRPADGASGWIDEAWDVYNTDESLAFEVQELVRQVSDPVILDDGDPFSRLTPNAAYDQGQELFAHLAFLVGLDELRAAMADYWAERAPGFLTTADLDAYLYCRTGDLDVAEAFWRWAWGKGGHRDAETLPECP